MGLVFEFIWRNLCVFCLLAEDGNGSICYMGMLHGLGVPFKKSALRTEDTSWSVLTCAHVVGQRKSCNTHIFGIAYNLGGPNFGFVQHVAAYKASHGCCARLPLF